MTEYIAECRIDGSDRVTARVDSSYVQLESTGDDNVYLRAGDARTFARGIFALADEIDGGEVKAEEPAGPKRAVRVGDTVRVLADDPGLRTGQFVGKVGKVRSLDRTESLPYNVQFDAAQRTPHRTWNVARVELLDEPASPLADWERDLLEPAPAPFAAHVDEAKRLLLDSVHTGADIVALACELADRA